MLLARLDGSVGTDFFWEDFFSSRQRHLKCHFNNVGPRGCLFAFLLKKERGSKQGDSGSMPCPVRSNRGGRDGSFEP
jgi:hypothetical protein